MTEALCVATWNAKKEKELLKWVSAREDRYVVWVVPEEIQPHPRMIRVGESELFLQQVAKELLYVPFVYEDLAHPALQRLARIQSELNLRASDFIDQGIKLLSNYRANLENPFSLAETCFGKFSSYAAVICGSGPSLQAALPFLKKNQDNFLIVGCGAGMKELMKAGIRPHVAVHIDPDPTHQFLPSDVPLFFQLRTDAKMPYTGPRFLMPGAGVFPLERWIEERLGMPSPMDGGWTVGTQGAVLAKELGCKTLYFAGIDFNEPKPDWILADEWLKSWVDAHPELKCAPISEVEGTPGVSLIAQEVFKKGSQDGREIWNEIAASLGKCREYTDQFLSRLQTIFPKSSLEDGLCLSVVKELEKEVAVELILNPIWETWEYVLKRQKDDRPDSLLIHRILLLQSLTYV